MSKVICYKNGEISHDLHDGAATKRIVNLLKYCLNNKIASPFKVAEILQYPDTIDKLVAEEPLDLPRKWPVIQETVKEALTAEEYQAIKDLLRTATLEWFHTVVCDTDSEQSQ